MGSPEQGVGVKQDTLLEAAMATVSRQSRDIVILEAAVQDLQSEVTRLRNQLDSLDEEVDVVPV